MVHWYTILLHPDHRQLPANMYTYILYIYIVMFYTIKLTVKICFDLLDRKYSLLLWLMLCDYCWEFCVPNCLASSIMFIISVLLSLVIWLSFIIVRTGLYCSVHEHFHHHHHHHHHHHIMLFLLRSYAFPESLF